jgi:hypothetical protein
MTASDVRNLIAGGKIEQAIKELLAHLQHNGDNDLYNAILTQSSRYQDNERQNRLGMVSSSDYTRTRNAVTYALLESLEEVFAEGAGSPPSPGPEKPQVPPSQENNRAADTTTILFMASNPSGTAQLQWRNEHSIISTKIQQSSSQNKFVIKPFYAATFSDFQKLLLKEVPDVVHFSGHGDKKDSEARSLISRSLISRGLEVDETDIPQDDTGIILYNEDKTAPIFIPTNAIKHLFETIVKRKKTPIHAVIFNSCYSDAQAKAIAQLVPYVIGTSWSVKDDSAIAFATGFYLGIAEGEDIETSYYLGVSQALALGEPEDRFILYKDGQKVV